MELLNYQPTALSTIKDRFTEAKYDPTMLIKASLETIEEVTNGEVVLVDATTPAVMLLEMAAVQAAACIQENTVLLRKQYPVLAMDESDLYLHMSDEDYLNRFAVPSTPGQFWFAFQLDDLVREAVYDETERAKKLIIPRDTVIEVDGVHFSLLYPIVIRRYDNGALQISYDPSISNPIFGLKNTIIDPQVRRGTEQEDWLFFKVEALQVREDTEYFMVDKTYNFRKQVVLNDPFYSARVFYKNDRTAGNWIEIKTTHTDQVFDINVPTAVLKVGENTLTIEIPVIYTTSEVLSGELRIDIYTTKGAMSMNLRNYRQDAFMVTMRAIDEERDLSIYTQAMANVSYYVYSLDTITGGANPVGFEELRERVIYNSVGPQNLPITNVHLESEAINSGFEIVRNVDVLTNRIFLATRKLPKPTTAKLITPANIGIVSYVAKIEELEDHYQTIVNGERATIRSKTFWKSDNSLLSMVTRTELDALYAMGQTAMVSHINSSQYFYTPFYYVLDGSGDEFEIRSYALDLPYAKDQNFHRQNQTLQLFVNTGSYNLTKVHSGYQLRIVTKSGNYYTALEDSQVGVQLAFHPKGENAYAYILGILEGKTEEGNRIYRFDLNTNHDIDSEDLICITNSTVQGITDYQAWIDLETQFELLHFTTSITEQYRPDDTDLLLGKFMLPVGASGNSHESLTLHLGDALKNLWRRSRSFMTDTTYQFHQVDVPKLYEADEFDTDPVTGSIFTFDENNELVYLYKHRAGDPVLDDQGNQVYQYRAGDVMLDELGQPIVNTAVSTSRDIDILVVDGRYLFSDDPATIAYRSEVEDTLTSWIVDDIESLQQQLLEQSKIFFYPKTTLGIIEVNTENAAQDYLSAEQNFNVDLYVQYSIYNDNRIREQLTTATVNLLDQFISLQTINMTEIRDSLRSLYGESVTAFTVSGLGGDKDYQFITVTSKRNKLCLKKQLVIQADKTMIVKDAVNVSFKLVQ